MFTSYTMMSAVRKTMLERFLSWLGFGQEDASPRDERLDLMNSMLSQRDRMKRLIVQGTWKGRRGTWRTSKLTSVHKNIYYLIDTVRSTTNAVMSKTEPSMAATKSRRYLDNLYPVTLDNYLTDEQGLTCEPETIIRELIQAIEDLVNNIRAWEQKDGHRYEYYLRQCSHLFGELETIIKAYF
jgi:hypothetical protein